MRFWVKGEVGGRGTRSPSVSIGGRAWRTIERNVWFLGLFLGEVVGATYRSCSIGRGFLGMNWGKRVSFCVQLVVERGD